MTDDKNKLESKPYWAHRDLEKGGELFTAGQGDHAKPVLKLGELGDIGNGPDFRDALHHLFNETSIIQQRVEIAAAKIYDELYADGAIDALREQTKDADNDGIVMTADRMIAYANDVFEQCLKQVMQKNKEGRRDHRRIAPETLAIRKREAKPALFTEEELTGSASYVAGVIQETLNKAIGAAMSDMVGKTTPRLP